MSREQLKVEKIHLVTGGVHWMNYIKLLVVYLCNKILSFLYLPVYMARFIIGLLAAFTHSLISAQHTVYLIGDAGEPMATSSTMKQALAHHIQLARHPASILFLGDNIYPKGLPNKSEPNYEDAITILNAQVNWVKDLNVPVYFIPGNHDWERGGKHGWDRILNQQRLIDSLKNPFIHFFPKEGCAGPVEISLSANATLVIIDTQWFLHPWDKPEKESGCEAESSADILLALSDILYRNRNKQIIIAAHHPIITYGEHGGVYRLKDHLLPLTALHKNLIVPLPGIGSIYPLYRKIVGNIQDTAHPRYKQFSKSIETLIKDYPGTIYASGHEHALEYIIKDSVVYIVSGSGIKTTYVKKKGYAQFAKGVTGFARITFTEAGDQTTEFFQVDQQNPTGKMLWSTTQNAPMRMKEIPGDKPGNTSWPTTVRVRASEQYKASKSKSRWLGKNYRKEWETEIDVPVFNISREKGGLAILQKGGGMQTRSLRLQDSLGREWLLRSIEKYPENAVPEVLRKTFAEDLVQDQISAAHPYGALVVAPLADAAGIYHTNPKLVFIPDDPNLGIYQREFANRLALFEARPDGDARSVEHFGNSKKIISTTKVLEKLRKDNDNQVDQEFVLRSRLFDMWIGDWDRHDDQWRWATFEKEKGEVYRPIPRDRDQVFFVNEGRIPKIWSRKWALPKFEGFDEEINWASGLSFNARYFDRSFLTSLREEQWIRIATDLQRKLTDEVIENAIKQWPPAIFELHGEHIIRVLKKRRADLVHYAKSHYLFLSKEVDIVGSDKHELFEVNVLPTGDVHVIVHKTNKEGEQQTELYNRVFKHSETKEIRLYGLDGNDAFIVTGTTKSKIRIRIVGGEGEDQVKNEPGRTTRTLVYDVPGTIMQGKVRDKTSDALDVNQYDRKAFQYDRLAPLVYGNFNPDDGLFIGGGALYQTHGFRKTPFKQRHMVLASMAPLTNSYNFTYRGDFTQAIGTWNAELNIDIKAPNFVNNFFGMGNETVFDQQIDEQPGINARRAIDYYRFRFEEHKAELKVNHTLGKYGVVELGGMYQQIEIEEPTQTDRFIDTYPNTNYHYNRYGGVSWNYTIDQRDSKMITQRGLVLQVGGLLMDGLSSKATSFVTTTGSLSFYQSFRLPARITYAARIGGGRTIGNYQFYQAQILDGKTELRGFRKTRFYGDSKVFINNEIRVKLLRFRSYLFPASLGINAFYDVGRVWYKDANGNDPSVVAGVSTVWHRGFGGGIWFTPFNLTVLSTEVGHAAEGTLVYVRLGFLF
jgi:hypothetical protein